MVADFFTKPLQGILFINHRNTIIGITEADMPLYRKEYAAYTQLDVINKSRVHGVERSVLYVAIIYERRLSYEWKMYVAKIYTST